VKTNVLTSIIVSTLFYTTCLSTTLVVPLVLAARGDAGAAPAIETTRTWERSAAAASPDDDSMDTQAKLQMHRDLRLPQTDVPFSGSATRHEPMDISGPDAAMIKPGKVRAKTIRG